MKLIKNASKSLKISSFKKEFTNTLQKSLILAIIQIYCCQVKDEA
jgi:hypothetical protein